MKIFNILIYYSLLIIYQCSKIKLSHKLLNKEDTSILFSPKPFLFQNFNPSKNALNYLIESDQYNRRVYVFISKFTIQFKSSPDSLDILGNINSYFYHIY